MFYKDFDEYGWNMFVDTYKKAKIIFYEYYNENKYNPIIYYSVHYSIKSKRNQNVFLKQTGNGTLEYLLWAKNKIVEFEDFVVGRNRNNDNRIVKICIGADDNRRKKIYYRSLSKIGYVYENIEGKQVLVKTLHIN